MALRCPTVTAVCLLAAIPAGAQVRLPAVPKPLIVTVGPNGDFGDIQAAIDAVVDGTTVLVAPGSFSGFTVDDKKLTLIGSGNTQIKGPIVVRNLDPNDVTALADFEINTLDANANFGHVILNGVRASEDFIQAPLNRNTLIEVNGTADFRAHNLKVDVQGTTSLGCIAVCREDVLPVMGRIEIAQSLLLSAGGADDEEDGAAAGYGILICNGSFAHVAQTNVTCGNGGLSLGFGQGGDGGDAIQMEGNSDIVISGTPGQVIQSGTGGRSLFGFDGVGGNGVRILLDGQSKTVRYSGIALKPGDGGASSVDGEVVGPVGATDKVTIPPIDDPSLEVLGTPISGNPVPVTIRVNAALGAKVDVLLGTKAQVLDLGDGSVIDLLVVVEQIFNLGSVGDQGFVQIQLPFDKQPKGATFFVQAVAQDSTGLQRTNSGTLIVR